MRLLILWPDRQTACLIRDQMENHGWEAEILNDGRQLCRYANGYDVLLLHLCLPGLDGLNAGEQLAADAPVCPPRILFVSPAEWLPCRPEWADCTVEAGTSPAKLCSLIESLAKKPLPNLTAALQTSVVSLTEGFLYELALKKHMKGRVYAAWLLQRMVPATSAGQLTELYEACARAFAVTPASVERCLRTAVESVFTQGSMTGIERFFGATIDPERGKPTNRAFLAQAVAHLRMQLSYSRTAARSPNSSVMHHNPAAPTSV